MKTIVKRCAVQLVKESSHKYDVPKTLRCPDDAVEFIKNVIDFDAIPCELFIVVPIDSKSKPLCVTIVTKGTPCPPSRGLPAVLAGECSGLLCLP